MDPRIREDDEYKSVIPTCPVIPTSLAIPTSLVIPA
jgi:hypothetical protein